MIFIILCFLAAYLLKKLNGAKAYLLSPVTAFVSAFLTVAGSFIFSGREYMVGGVEGSALILGTFQGTIFVCFGIWIFRRQDAAAKKKKEGTEIKEGAPKT